ncbi:MAG: glucose 1-dehydrogenase [Actinobacteria bacterium]|nr:glucose 1-dehydrogenase [Actinomycetota bacterium]
MPLDPLAAFRLDGRVAVVTGASSGLGARFAQVLDGAGASVVLAARRLDRLESLAAGLRDAHAVRCDVADPADRSALIDATIERYGRIDVLVNNAGTTNVVPALEETDDDFAEVLAVNLTAPFALARLAATRMIAQGEGGAVVNVASMLGVVASGRIPQASYTASKGGLVHLTRELAAQWARDGVRVNALGPGWFASEMTGGMFEDDQGLAFIRRGAPMGRPGEEHELDGALLFLASAASSYVTGQTLVVDGGWSSI